MRDVGCTRAHSCFLLVSVTKNESVSVGLAVILFLLLNFLSCLSPSTDSSSSPSTPGIEKKKFHQNIHITIKYCTSRSTNPGPRPPTHRCTDPPPTTYRQTDPPPTNHKPRLHSHSAPFAQSPAQNHTTRVRVRVRTASPNLARLEIPACAVRQAPDIFVQSPVLGLGSWVYFVL